MIMIQDDVPKDSLKFFYGPKDDPDSKGGFTSVSVSTEKMTVTFYNYKGITNGYMHPIKLIIMIGSYV